MAPSPNPFAEMSRAIINRKIAFNGSIKRIYDCDLTNHHYAFWLAIIESNRNTSSRNFTIPQRWIFPRHQLHISAVYRSSGNLRSDSNTNTSKSEWSVLQVQEYYVFLHIQHAKYKPHLTDGEQKKFQMDHEIDQWCSTSRRKRPTHTRQSVLWRCDNNL